MRLITVVLLLFIVQISAAAISELHPINPSEDGTNYGSSPLRQGMFPYSASSTSSNGRFVAYLTEHENLDDALTVDIIAHRYDRTLNTTLSSTRIMKGVQLDTSALMQVVFEDASAQSILLTNLEPDVIASNGFSGVAISRYVFDSQDASLYKNGIGYGWSMSSSRQFFAYVSLGALYVFDHESNTEISVPASFTLTNGNVINFLEPSIVSYHSISDQGDMILVADSDSKGLEGASNYYKYNVITGGFISFNSFISSEYDLNINDSSAPTSEIVAALSIPLISSDGQYISLGAKNSAGKLVVLLFDTISSNVVEHELPLELNGSSFLRPRLLSNTGVVQYFAMLEGATDPNKDWFAYYLYDFKSEKVLENTVIYLDKPEAPSERQVKWVDQIALDGDFVVIQDVSVNVISNEPYQEEADTRLFWANLSENNENSISITSTDTIIDPYLNQASQFTIDVSGTDIYGLEVNCNITSDSLSVTEANYEGVFGSQNTMTLPLIYTANSIAAKETLIAPELSFTGAGSFVLADIIAEFTTEDVEITCAADILDENGQILQAVSTSATVRIDDGIHGGTGSVSGNLNIPGVTDLSGREVVLTIDGRQITVITDETGHYKFEGLRDGDFTISLESDRYVQSCQAVSVSGSSSVDLGTIELLAGDVNSDGSIGIADFILVASRYRSIQGDNFYDSRGDFNADGTIDIQDLMILDSNFGSTQCNPLPQ